MDKQDLQKKKTPELKLILKDKGLKVYGNKIKLIDRILNNQPKFPLSNLPPDVLRVTALNLPVKDIFNLCKTNKQYQQIICNNKPFWQNAFAFYILL